MPDLRVATFNLENLSDNYDGVSLADRLPVLRPALNRLRADIVMLQEVNAQRDEHGERHLSALDELVKGTRYEPYERAWTTTEDGKLRIERNTVTLSRFPIEGVANVRNDLVKPGTYTVVYDGKQLQKQISIDRPLLHVTHRLPDGTVLHTVNIHLKSKRPTSIQGAQAPDEPWKWISVAGWAEGYFLSSMKRVTQALELRLLVDSIFDDDPLAQIVVGGDFNSDLDDVPVEAVRGRPQNTANPDLTGRAMLPVEISIATSGRWTLIHHGRQEMIDHLLISRSLVGHYRSTEIHNEAVHDESISFAFDSTYPESDHAAVVATFDFDD